MFTIQYLEDRPELANLPVEAVQARLREAFERLPVSIVILGWNVPDTLFTACEKEVQRGGAKLYRWHPLLTGDAAFEPRPEWQMVGLDGERVSGFRGLPEFTFLCPNCPPAADAALEHFRQAIRRRRYAGVFLDRMRFPSPAAAPERSLACFCPSCQRAAQKDGLDLIAARSAIAEMLASPQDISAVLSVLLGNAAGLPPFPGLDALKAILAFRGRSITRFVAQAAAVARGEGLEVGLDCFSPALSVMVGQDLAALDPLCNWIKVMTYAHALGPAALPYEFSQLAGWLVQRGAASETGVMKMLSRAAGLALPDTRSALARTGLSPQALGQEVRRARAMGVRQLLAGIELVEVAGVAQLNERQIATDVRVLRAAQPGGLALSWDLSWMPLERLELLRREWEGFN